MHEVKFSDFSRQVDVKLFCSSKPLNDAFHYLINFHGRLLFSEQISRVGALIRCVCLSAFWQNSSVDVYSDVDLYEFL